MYDEVYPYHPAWRLKGSGRLRRMDRSVTTFRLTLRAKALLRTDEAFVFDWHRLAICCAGAGETSLSVMKEATARERAGLVRLKGEVPVYAARAIAPHLAGRKITLDARKLFGVRFFTSDLPKDFGLRSVFGRLPAEDRTAS
jgi:hypothetical protein